MAKTKSDPTPTESGEIVIGLVGAVGTDLELVCSEIKIALRKFKYGAAEIRLSALLEKMNWSMELPRSPLDRHIASHMDAGNELRTVWDRGDAVALLGLTKVADLRASKNADDAPDAPLGRFAYLFRSLKHPSEIELLRSIYGSRLYVVSAYAPSDVRENALLAELAKQYGSEEPADWAHTPKDLILRDEAERELQGNTLENPDMGQNVRDTFHRADFFLDARSKSGLKRDIKRMLEIIFGHPFRTPTVDEYALFEAEGAAKRSSEPGRQVGAAIVGTAGTVIALGSNEVPRSGGGTYWEGSKPDGREFRFCDGIETNASMRHEIAEEIAQELSDGGWLKQAAREKSSDVMVAIERTRLGNIIEFGRAAHAEMDALLDAARRGVSVQGGTLYTTTYPCHNCARHIVLAGIKKVIYVAPYAKSLARMLHGDSIEVARDNPADHAVHFEPFVGVAPRRYLDFFEADRRKDERTGELRQFDPSAAMPKLADAEPEDLRPRIERYMLRERAALELMAEIWQGTGLALKTEEEK